MIAKSIPLLKSVPKWKIKGTIYIWAMQPTVTFALTNTLPYMQTVQSTRYDELSPFISSFPHLLLKLKSFRIRPDNDYCWLIILHSVRYSIITASFISSRSRNAVNQVVKKRILHAHRLKKKSPHYCLAPNNSFQITLLNLEISDVAK